MPRLLSGSTLRRGGSGEFLDLKGAQPQLPPSPSTSTGFTIVTDALLRTTYRSSLGNLEFNLGEIQSNILNGNITLTGTGTGIVLVSRDTVSISTDTGALVVNGGVGVGGSIWTTDLWSNQDIHVNGLTIGQGFAGYNNIVIQGVAAPQINEFNNGQETIAIGYDALTGLSTSYKNIALGRYALSSGTDISNSIAIGDSALKEIGTIHSVPIGVITTATFIPISLITNATNDDPVVITSSAHGLNTGTKVFITGVVGMTATITVGLVTSTISLVNDQAFWVDKVSDNELALYGNRTLTATVSGTDYSSYISGGSIFSPLVITVSNHGLVTGTSIIITEINGLSTGTTSLLNNNTFWVDNVGIDSLALYTDPALLAPVDATDYSDYENGGIISVPALWNNNIAIGIDVAKSLTNGELNLFFGDQAVKNLVTGSYNIFIGHEVGNNMISGNANISIGGDNLVDGLDNQLNIGSVIYYNGGGYLQLNADTGVGLGTLSTGTQSGALVVLGGAGISENLITGGKVDIGTSLRVSGTSTFLGTLLPFGSVDIGSPSLPFNSLYLSGTTLYLSTVTLKSPSALEFNVESTAGFVTQTVGNLFLNSTEESISDVTGALVVDGGIGVSGNVNIGGELNVLGGLDVQISPAGGNVTIQPSVGGSVYIYPAVEGTLDNIVIGSSNSADGTFDTLIASTVQSTDTTNSTGTDTGALQVAGGAGIAKDVWIGGNLNVAGTFNATSLSINTATNLSGGDTGSIPYQSDISVTTFLAIGSTGSVLLSNGSTPYWGESGASISNTATNSNNIFVNNVSSGTLYYLGLTEIINDYSQIDSDAALTYDTTSNVLTVKKVLISSTASSNSTTTDQALVINGGIGVDKDAFVSGSVYSREGNIDENYLLYSTRVTVSTTPPDSPRIGDFWIDPNFGVELQYIKDGTSTFWIQFTGL